MTISLAEPPRSSEDQSPLRGLALPRRPSTRARSLGLRCRREARNTSETLTLLSQAPAPCRMDAEHHILE